MLVRFTSSAAGTITMFGDVAVELIRMMGASGRVPGAISADDIAPAILRLQRGLASRAGAQPADAESLPESDPVAEPAVAIATRAVPLLDLLQRSSAGNSPVMWDSD